MSDFMNPGSKATQVILSQVKIAASGNYSVVIDTWYMNKLLPVLRQVYANVHATTTGVTVTKRYGIEVGSTIAPADATTSSHKGTDKNILFTSDSDPVAVALPTPAGGAQTKVSDWAETLGDKQRFIEYTFTNTDASNAATIDLWGTT